MCCSLESVGMDFFLKLLPGGIRWTIYLGIGYVYTYISQPVQIIYFSRIKHESTTGGFIYVCIMYCFCTQTDNKALSIMHRKKKLKQRRKLSKI